jgi:hypothetical protein
MAGYKGHNFLDYVLRNLFNLQPYLTGKNIWKEATYKNHFSISIKNGAQLFTVFIIGVLCCKS